MQQNPLIWHSLEPFVIRVNILKLCITHAGRERVFESPAEVENLIGKIKDTYLKCLSRTGFSPLKFDKVFEENV